MKKIFILLAELEKQIPHQGLLNPQVSKAAVGWHIEHALLTLQVISEALNRSTPSHYKSSFDMRRQVVMLLGIIPRGKVKAPTVVRPSQNYNEASLQQHLLTVKEGLKSLENVTPDHYFSHPFLGDFKLKPALKFMNVHTHHHLKIINDIMKHKQTG
jgi:hypothetical protein